MILGLIDRLAVRGQGEELDAWLGMLELKEPKQRGIIIAGERGKQLLALEPSTGFKERAVIALHRGVAELEAGQQLDALRSFGFAMAHADESSDPNAVMSLSRRWLSYVLSRFQTNGEVLGTLRALVPRQDYNIVIEELLWRAALRADKSSFELIASTVQKGSSLDQRIDKLKPMARGDVGLLATQLRSSTPPSRARRARSRCGTRPSRATFGWRRPMRCRGRSGFPRWARRRCSCRCS
ncbi:MAG: hypothetical protein IPJ65_25145 [Archangiaceae bacterium]|nr:hypothetical protein [Archangiaceae bacterium]